MKKLLYFFTFAFSLLIVFSCEPNRAENGDLLFGVGGNSGNGNTPTVSKKLKSFTVNDGTNVITYSFTYNSDGNLSKLISSDDSGNFEFFYDANKSINKISATQWDGSLTTTTNFAITYENGRFKEAKGNGSESDGTEFTHNFTAVYNNGKVSKITSKMVGIDSADPTVTYDLYTMVSDIAYSGNNLSTWKYTLMLPIVPLPTVEISAAFSDFDTHINPFRQLPEVFKIIAAHLEMDSFSVTGFSANNYGKIKIVTNSDSQTATYVYTYDADGYPTKAVAENLGTYTFQYQ
ncbi:hypothetical protein [Chryseobacterium koreense]|uniref:hypothetical protein n=1 Tax=Chryseobacterium koreense TaxID=232216 RepID=UPI0026F21CEC|nr:hypothetical protein [Chryseobacterium koreense]